MKVLKRRVKILKAIDWHTADARSLLYNPSFLGDFSEEPVVKDANQDFENLEILNADISKWAKETNEKLEIIFTDYTPIYSFKTATFDFSDLAKQLNTQGFFFNCSISSFVNVFRIFFC